MQPALDILCTFTLFRYLFVYYHANNSIGLYWKIPNKTDFHLVTTNQPKPTYSERQTFLRNLIAILSSSYWVSKDVKSSIISTSGAFYYSKHQLTHQISSSQFPCYRFGSQSSQLPSNFSFSVYFPIQSFVKVAQMTSSAYFIFHVTFQVCF